MATVTVGGSVATFGRGLDQIVGARLFFVPPTPGFVAATPGVEAAIMSDKPIPADMAGDGSGRFTAELEPVDNIRPAIDKQGRPWGYGIRIEIPAPDMYGGTGGYIHLDLPDFRVFVTAEGGNISSMIDARLRPIDLWSTSPGIIPELAVAGDFIYNYTQYHYGQIVQGESMLEVIDLGSLRGATGATGPTGPVNPASVPTDEALATWVPNTATETGAAIDGVVKSTGANVGRGVNGKNPIRNFAKLARFEAAMAIADTSPAVITVLGHSIVWGVGSDDLNLGQADTTGRYRQDAWPVILRKLYARAFNIPVAENFIGVAPGFGYATLSSSPAPARSATIGPFGNVVSNPQPYGGYNLYAAGAASATIPAAKSGRCTHVDVFYWGLTSGVSIPNIPKVTVDTVVKFAGTTDGAAAGTLGVTAITGLASGTHDIVVSHPSGTNNTFTFGLVTHFGKGVIVNRIGSPGITVSSIGDVLADAARLRNIYAAVLYGYSDLVIIELDTNDVYAQTPIATWKTRMQELIDVVKGANACVLILGSPPIQGGEALTIPESAYYTAAAELSDANAHTAFYDSRPVFGDRPTAYEDGMYPPGATGTVHPGRLGHLRMAEALFDALPIGGIA